MPAPGPPALGRGVVVNVGAPVPPAWAGAPVVTVADATLDDPSGCVAELHAAWIGRRPVVVALDVDPARFRAPQSWTAEPWTLDPSFEPWLDRLHFLVWANTYDARRSGAEPVWWWSRKAERLGAEATPGGSADVVLPGGRPAWVDGGPRGPLDAGGLGAAVVHAESVEFESLAVVPPRTDPSADLAPDQLAAVAHGAGPARIIAPAGSGKTRVLTERLRHLAVDRRFERETVLAVAYNKKAQLQLEERCADFEPRAQTLNALGFALVTQALGRSPRVLDEREVRRVVEDLVPRGRRRANTDRIGPYLEALSAVRLGLRDPGEVEEERDDVPGFAAAFDPYREQLASRGAIDFDEQVYGAVEALLAGSEFRRRAQHRCRHLLVDEFQDLTPAHVLMLRLLATPQLDVFGVGDDDQVIYGHAGADPAFLTGFGDLFPGAATHALEVNYRCPVAVTTAARHLLSYNHRRVEKDIRAGEDADPGDGCFEVRTDPPDAGAAALAEVVSAWLAEPGVDSSQVAVLTRVSSLLLAPQVALVEAGVPVDSVLRPDVLDRTGVRAALAYLRIAVAPASISGDDVAEVYRRPSRGLPPWFTKWLRGSFTLQGLEGIADKIDDSKVAAKVRELVGDLRLVADVAETGTTRDVLGVIEEKVGLGGAMGMLDSSRASDGGSSHLDDLEALEQVAALHPDPRSFEPWLRSVFHREATEGGVTLSTVHRVKGREWDRVAVFGVSAGLVPHRLALDVEEERRVLHVAITRGIHRVTVFADSTRPSPFLAELDGSAPRRAPGQATGPGVDGEPAGAAGAGRAGRAGSAAPKSPPADDLSPEDERAFEALRAWRLERSRADGVPAYVVLADKYLRGIARARPRTLEELRALPGIGPTKLELYGDELLAVVEGLAGDGR